MFRVVAVYHEQMDSFDLENWRIAPKLLSEEIKTKAYRLNNYRASFEFLFTYSLIAFSFALPIYYPHPVTFILSAFILGGRQLALAILMHDCAHRAYFSSPGLNDFVGKWLCGAPILADVDQYRTYHMKHHRCAGTEDDPDLPNYKPYPVSKSSFARKVFRDLIGITGLKILLLLIKMNLGLTRYQLSYKEDETFTPAKGLGEMLMRGMKGLHAPVLANIGLWLILKSLGHGNYYWLWPISYLTTYMVFSRIRNAAEHAAVIDLQDLDPRNHTRTTIAPFWQRIFLAPHQVNYHLEHHLLPQVPSYHLKMLHNVYIKQGFIQKKSLAFGYGEVISKLVSAPPS